MVLEPRRLPSARRERSSRVALETERLFLRAFTPADARSLWELDNDPEVMRYISRGRSTPLDVIERKILPRWIAYGEDRDCLGYWATHEKASAAFIGWFHLKPDRYCPGEMELGFRLHRRVWCKGYATEGAWAILAKALDEWGMERVVARALVGNLASRRVMEKCGLSRETWFSYDAGLLPGWTAEERRAVKYGINKTDYLAMPAAGLNPAR